MNITVINWVNYDSNYPNAPIGGLGGWFNANLIHDPDNPTAHVWDDYIEAFSDKAKPYLEALKAEITAKNIKIKGDYHQNVGYGAPLFSDNTVGRFSYRAWGDLMAGIYSTKENPLHYMVYYI